MVRARAGGIVPSLGPSATATVVASARRTFSGVDQATEPADPRVFSLGS